MGTASADRNLLFGVLAVQLDFISRDDLIAATSRWVLDKEQPLSDVFVEQGMISGEEAQLLDGVVKKHLQRNGDDPTTKPAVDRSLRGLTPRWMTPTFVRRQNSIR